MERSRGIDYTFGYYVGMNPNRASFTLANRGFLAPKIETACELGFGQGVSLAINAATSNRSWTGTDIEPAQVSFARNLVGHLDQDKCRVYGESFKEFKVAWNWSKPTYKALLEIAGSENRIRYFNSKTKSNFSNDLIRELVKQKTKIYQEKLLSKSFYVRPGEFELVDVLKKAK